MKRPMFSFLMTAPRNVKVGLHELGNRSRCLGAAFHLYAFYLFTFQKHHYKNIKQSLGASLYFP